MECTGCIGPMHPTVFLFAAYLIAKHIRVIKVLVKFTSSVALILILLNCDHDFERDSELVGSGELSCLLFLVPDDNPSQGILGIPDAGLSL